MNSIMKIKQRIILIALLFSFGCIPHSDKRILIGDKWQYLVLSDRFNGDTNGLTFAEAKDVSKLADLFHWDTKWITVIIRLWYQKWIQ